MKVFEAELRSLTPLIMNRYHNTLRDGDESTADYEERTVLGKLHVVDSEIVIPARQFIVCLVSTARLCADRIAMQYRHGLICPEPVRLGLQPQDARIIRVGIGCSEGDARESV